MRLHTLALTALVTCLAACGEDMTPICTDPATLRQNQTTPCSPAWDKATAYTAGNQVSRASVNYRANWWTQGDDPSLQSGGAGSGKPWTVVATCGGATPTAPAKPQAPTSPAPQAPVATLPAVSGGKLIYSAYKDVSINANWNTSVISTAVTGSLVPLLQLSGQVPAITWAFATGECGQENWGGLAAQTLATANVAAWASAQKPYIISTGGAAGAFTCGSDAGFTAFLDRYMSASMLGVDFDIEAGQTGAQIDALIARVKAAQAQSKYSRLRFSFTIATLGGNAPQSLGGAGTSVMQAIQKAGLKNYYINLMAMDYGSATAANCTQATDGTCAMGLSANQAAINLHQTYNVPYAQIELTPMIGGNDTQGETFSLADADVVTAFAKRMGLGGVHFWSLDRDRDCAPGWASPTCNSYGQAGNLGFSARFAKGLQ